MWAVGSRRYHRTSHLSLPVHQQSLLEILSTLFLQHRTKAVHPEQTFQGTQQGTVPSPPSMYRGMPQDPARSVQKGRGSRNRGIRERWVLPNCQGQANSPCERNTLTAAHNKNLLVVLPQKLKQKQCQMQIISSCAPMGLVQPGGNYESKTRQRNHLLCNASKNPIN